MTVTDYDEINHAFRRLACRTRCLFVPSLEKLAESLNSLGSLTKKEEKGVLDD